MFITHVLIVVLLFLGACPRGSAVRIAITTLYHETNVVPSAFNIQCTAESSRNCDVPGAPSKDILFIQISKGNGKIIAGIKGDNSIFYGPLLTSSVEAEGHIDRINKNRTSFSVTISNAIKEDSGMYICTAHYIDENGQLKQERDRKNVTVGEQDLQDLLRHMLAKMALLDNLVKFHQESSDERIASVETRLHEQDDEYNQKSAIMRKEFSLLEAKVDRQGIHISHQDKGIFDSAFSYKYQYSRNDKKIQPGDVIKCPILLLNTGDHYDPQAGIFTASQSGLYIFQLYMTGFDSHRRRRGDNLVSGQIMLNNVTQIAKVTSTDDRSSKSSMNTIVFLNAGDTVSPSLQSRHSSTTNFHATFSGCLLSSYNI